MGLSRFFRFVSGKRRAVYLVSTLLFLFLTLPLFSLFIFTVVIVRFAAGRHSSWLGGVAGVVVTTTCVRGTHSRPTAVVTLTLREGWFHSSVWYRGVAVTGNRRFGQSEATYRTT